MNINKLLGVSVAAVGIGLFGGSAHAENVDVDINATLVTAASSSVPVNGDLNFGSITVVPAAGTITIDASAAATTSYTATALLSPISITGLHSGIIRVSGLTGVQAVPTFPGDGDPSLDLAGSCGSITVSGLAANSSANCTLAAGTCDLNIGGVLTLTAASQPCAYTNTMTVSVTYQ